MTLQAQNANLKKSVEECIKTSIQQTENREWKEAFATCRQLDGLIAIQEQKTKKAAPELHYLVSKERLRMYMRLSNKQKECQEKQRIQRKLTAQKNDPLYDDIHQIAGDLRFIKNFIIFGMVCGVALGVIGVLSML